MERTEKPRVISCGILRTEIERLMASGDIDVEVQFLSEKLHMDYQLLERGLSGALRNHRRQSSHPAVVVYGDVCLGFNGEMQALMDRYGAVKVDALNCIDCLLGGQGKLLELDPDHKYLFLNPAFIHFGEKVKGENATRTREMYRMLDGIILLDALGDLDTYRDKIEEIAQQTGLPIVERRNIGLGGLKTVLLETLSRHRQQERHPVSTSE